MSSNRKFETTSGIRLDPFFLPARFNLATLLNRQGRNAEAETVLRAGIDRVPDDGELHYSLGLLLAEEQRLGEAAESLGQAAALIPERVRVAYNHGLALETLGRLAAAEEAFLEANRRDAEDPDVLRALARVLLRQGELDRAARRPGVRGGRKRRGAGRLPPLRSPGWPAAGAVSHAAHGGRCGSVQRVWFVSCP